MQAIFIILSYFFQSFLQILSYLFETSTNLGTSLITFLANGITQTIMLQVYNNNNNIFIKKKPQQKTARCKIFCNIMASGERIDEGICHYYLTDETVLNFLKPKRHIEILPLFVLLRLLGPLVYEDFRQVFGTQFLSLPINIVAQIYRPYNKHTNREKESILARSKAIVYMFYVSMSKY